MALTKDQKTALTVAGIAAGVALLLYLSRGGIVIPVGATVNPAPQYDQPTPGYTTFNVQPASLAGVQMPPSLAPVFNQVTGSGARCCDNRDGCFTASPIDTGRGPLSLDQLVAFYSATNPAFASAWAQTLQSYGYGQ